MQKRLEFRSHRHFHRPKRVTTHRKPATSSSFNRLGIARRRFHSCGARFWAHFHMVAYPLELAEGCSAGTPDIQTTAAEGVPPWFAIRVSTRSEWTVARRLEQQGFECLVAEVREYRRTAKGEMRRHDRVAFPGYVFVRFHADAKAIVLATRGVHKVLSVRGVAASIPDAEITSLRLALAEGAQPAPEIELGQKVRIVCGPLRGAEGTLSCYTGHTLQIAITLMQRAVRVEIDPRHIEKC